MPTPATRSASPTSPALPRRSALLLWSGRHALNIGIVVSFSLHALLLSLNFRMPERKPATQPDRGLEVVLVNARHLRAPDKPQALAQANLDGGGSTDRDARPSSPLPPQDNRRDGDALLDQKRRSKPDPVKQQPVLSRDQAKQKAPAAVRNPIEAEAAPAVHGLDLLDSAAAIARMEASIEQRLEELAKRPRRKAIGARTSEYRFAQYVEDWRQKVERVGTLNYPEAARGRFYGSLLVVVEIRADGSVENAYVKRSSGNPVLDEAALRIVNLAAPYAPFPPEVRADTDIIQIVRTWTFTNTDRLKAE